MQGEVLGEDDPNRSALVSGDDAFTHGEGSLDDLEPLRRPAGEGQCNRELARRSQPSVCTSCIAVRGLAEILVLKKIEGLPEQAHPLGSLARLPQGRNHKPRGLGPAHPRPGERRGRRRAAPGRAGRQASCMATSLSGPRRRCRCHRATRPTRSGLLRRSDSRGRAARGSHGPSEQIPLLRLRAVDIVKEVFDHRFVGVRQVHPDVHISGEPAASAPRNRRSPARSTRPPRFPRP